MKKDLAAPSGQARAAERPTVDEFAQQIRWLNGSNKMGAGSLAEKLLEWLQSRTDGAPRMAFCPACFVEVTAEDADQQTRDARRWRWLVAQHNISDLPIAQVVWKRGSDPRGEWVNLIDGHDLIAHVDHGIAAQKL